nr:LapA family protein [Candidatus Omnitrophota bacterium]
MKPKMITMFVSGGLFLIILLQNTQVVSLRFLFWQLSMSQIILLPIVILIGFVIGIFVGRA